MCGEGENEVMMIRVYVCGLKFPHTEIDTAQCTRHSL